MSISAGKLKVVKNQRPIIPNLITIASGKGGVGKTWFASTLAHAMAYKGRRILLFDGDLGLANVDVQLGLTPKVDLANVISGSVPFSEAVTPFQGGASAFNDGTPEAARSKAGFDVLAGRSGSGTLGSMSRNQLAELIHSLKGIAEDYDYVICDLAAGIDNAAKILSTPSGRIYVVLTDEPTSLTDAYAFIKVMTMRYPDIPVEIVVNMAEDKAEGRRTFATLAKACENFLSFEPKLAGIVHKDPNVKATIRQQAPIITRYPTSRASKDVREIAEKAVKL
jgi:flagellar biosynthesis protein FlhG